MMFSVLLKKVNIRSLYCTEILQILALVKTAQLKPAIQPNASKLPINYYKKSDLMVYREFNILATQKISTAQGNYHNLVMISVYN